MVNQSLFFEILDKYFKPFVGKIVEKFNGKDAESVYLHKTMCVEEYSTDCTWGSTELNNSIVAADVVSMDSALPVKMRDKITSASGRLPKMGLKFQASESLMKVMDDLKNKGGQDEILAGKLLQDVAKVVKGIDTRNEIMFQEALSTGVTLTTSEDNVGTGVRVDFGYKPQNMFHATTAKWGEVSATPQDDLQQMFDKANADGKTIGIVMMSRKYFDLFRKSVQGKQLAAAAASQVVTNVDYLAVPPRERFKEVLRDEFGAEFRIVDSTFIVEDESGNRKSVRPWKEANIVGIPSEKVGRIVYGTSVEENHPVPGVSYEKAGKYILVSKFSTTDPLIEKTAGQALCLPVIDGADGIYVLHADSANTAVKVDSPTLTFAASGDNVGVNVGVHADGEFTVESDAAWCKVFKRNGAVVVKAAENTGATRNTTVKVACGDDVATIAVTQEAKA